MKIRFIKQTAATLKDKKDNDVTEVAEVGVEYVDGLAAVLDIDDDPIEFTLYDEQEGEEPSCLNIHLTEDTLSILIESLIALDMERSTTTLTSAYNELFNRMTEETGSPVPRKILQPETIPEVYDRVDEEEDAAISFKGVDPLVALHFLWPHEVGSDIEPPSRKAFHTIEQGFLRLSTRGKNNYHSDDEE